MLNRRQIGSYGEHKGFDFLKKKGYHILKTNYRTIYGELDIIAKEKDYIVFVEVKLRRSKDFGLPSESVNFRKQERIVKSALSYIKKNNLINSNIRFDILSIGPEQDKIELIKSAFDAEPSYTL